MTQSGYTCQAWTSQCPHRHQRTPDNFSELNIAGNACRNPGGQAPHGPWCYTTNRKQRWEYCRVEKCEAHNESEGLFMENVKGLTCLCFLMSTYYIFSQISSMPETRRFVRDHYKGRFFRIPLERTA